MTTTLDKMARLGATVGCNLAPGQPLIVQAPPEAAPLVAALRSAAGPLRLVEEDPDALRARLIRGELPDVPADEMMEVAREMAAGAARIRILAPRPDILDGVDPSVLRRAHEASGVASARALALLGSVTPTDAAILYPTTAWATRVFPDLAPAQALARLWDAMAIALRLDTDDPVAEWHAHLGRIETLRARLDALGLRSLRMSGGDTDLTLALQGGADWSGALADGGGGRRFAPMLPAEGVSVAIAPAGTAGAIRFTRPIAIAGKTVEGLAVRLVDGRLASLTAGSGGTTLRRLLCEGPAETMARRLTLVDRRAPAARTGLDFHNPALDLCTSNGLGFVRRTGVEHDAPAMWIDACFVGEGMTITGTDADGQQWRLVEDGMITLGAPAG